MTTKPIIKWAGGKTQLLNELIPMMPESYNNYFEPFIGGGALFFALQPERALINDYNTQLINLYAQCRDNAEELMQRLDQLAAEHQEDPEHYYTNRALYNACIERKEHSVESAALFIYLNKAGFNGLYRLNSKGLFNVPTGRKKKVNLYEQDNINNVSKLLKGTELTTGDFENACEKVGPGDFVFFDSPYYNTFDTYQAGGFSEEDHKRLAKLFQELTDRGAYCMLTNSNEDFIKELYRNFNIKEVAVKRMINRDADKRTGEEVIITNYTK